MSKVDKSKMFLGFDYVINDKLTLRNPSIREVVEFGEDRYFSIVHTLASIPSDFKSRLWDSGIDYESISDFDLFIMLTRGMTPKDTKLVFGDLDLSKFKVENSTQNGNAILKNGDIIIDEHIYIDIVSYLRGMHNITPKIERSSNSHVKHILIEEDRTNIKMRMAKEHEPFLYNLLVSMINTEEFKYNSKDVLDISIYEFLESVSQIQHKKHACSLVQGSYSGMVDMSKIKKKDLSWIRA